MGLDTTHNAFHGGYGSFMSWRIWVGEQVGIPLELMEGFYDKEHDPFILLKYKFPDGDELSMGFIRRLEKMLPLKWASFKPTPLHTLLYHSDCDGYINWTDCGKIARELRKILSSMESDNTNSQNPEVGRSIYDGMYNATKRFMEGCELAFSKKERLGFH